MEFCNECGSMMMADSGTWVCRSCGAEKAKDQSKEYVAKEDQEESEIVDVSESGERGLPTTEASCPSCGHDRAFWYLQQTRSSDESETRFFICVECDHKWRGYD